MSNFSATGWYILMKRDAMEEMREIPSCGVTGEAAGTTEALTLKEKTSLKQLEIKVLSESLVNQQ